MGQSKRHHFIPQVHIRYFKGNEGYFVYDKELSKIVTYNNSNSFFYRNNLNKKFNFRTSEIDTSIEEELGVIFDDNFNHHLNNISYWGIRQLPGFSDLGEVEINPSLRFFFEYSLIGFFRRFSAEKSQEENLIRDLELFREIKDLPNLPEIASKFEFANNEEFSLDKLMTQMDTILDSIKSKLPELKYPVPIPTDLKALVPENLCCELILSPNFDIALPDVGGLMYQSDDKNTWMGLEFKVVKSIELPLSKNMFIRIKNSDYLVDKSNKLIKVESKEEVFKINKKLFKASLREILFSNPEDIDEVVK